MTQNLVEEKIGLFDAHAAGFNLGKIEDVVDDGEQVIGGGIDPAEPSALSGIKIRLQQ